MLNLENRDLGPGFSLMQNFSDSAGEPIGSRWSSLWLRKNSYRFVIAFRDSFLEALFDAPCPVCNKPLRSREGTICQRCLVRAFGRSPVFPPALDDVHLTVSAVPYAPEIRTIIHGLKYHERTRTAERLRPLLRESLRRSGLSKPAAVVPVPLHATRKRERGYNQSEVLAKMVADLLQVPLRTDLVLRRRPTRSQTRLNRWQRQLNVAGAFQRQPVTSAPSSILLVDDVLTTGATLEAVAALFPDLRVDTWTLAWMADHHQDFVFD